MNNLIKILLLRLQNESHITEFMVSKDERRKESKSFIILSTIIIFSLIYLKVIDALNLSTDNIFKVSYIICFIIMLIYSFITSFDIIYKESANNLLLTLPLNKKHIILSSLFIVYLKNLIISLIIMLSILFKTNIELTDTFLIIYFLEIIFLPIVPIIISNIIIYLKESYKINKNKLIFLLIPLIALISYILIKRPTIISLIFVRSININIIYFIISILLPIVLTRIYLLTCTKNYELIIEITRGVKRNNNFEYQSSIKLPRLLSLVKKDLKLIKETYIEYNVLLLITSITYLLVTLLTNIKEVESNELFNLFLPLLLALVTSLFVTTDKETKQEHNNKYLLRTLPISYNQMILSKWLTNIVIVLPYIIINGLITVFTFKLNITLRIMSFLLPLLLLMLNSLFTLIVNTIYLNEIENNIIIPLIPKVLAILTIALPFFIPYYLDYKMELYTYTSVIGALVLINYLYLIIKRKQIEDKLFK